MVWSCATNAGMWLANFASPCASMRVCIHVIDEPNSKKAKCTVRKWYILVKYTNLSFPPAERWPGHAGPRGPSRIDAASQAATRPGHDREAMHRCSKTDSFQSIRDECTGGTGMDTRNFIHLSSLETLVMPSLFSIRALTIAEIG